MMEIPESHTTVLLAEAVDALITDPEGIYVDGTFGRGGHSRSILANLSDHGRLWGIDKDPEAIDVGRALTEQDERFAIYHYFNSICLHNFVEFVDIFIADIVHFIA